MGFLTFLLGVFAGKAILSDSKHEETITNAETEKYKKYEQKKKEAMNIKKHLKKRQHVDNVKIKVYGDGRFTDSKGNEIMPIKHVDTRKAFNYYYHGHDDIDEASPYCVYKFDDDEVLFDFVWFLNHKKILWDVYI